MIKLKIAATVATIIMGLGTSAVASAQAVCHLELPNNEGGQLMDGHFLWFDQAAASKAPKHNPAMFTENHTDVSWAKKQAVLRPVGTRASYRLASGSHGWVENGKSFKLPADTIGVGCLAVAKK